MYTTTGIDAVATITELRSHTSELIEHIRERKGALLIQKNNAPYAVLLDWETYQQLTGGVKQETGPEHTPKRKSRRKKSSAASGTETGSS